MKRILYWTLLLLLVISCSRDDSTMLYPSQNPDFSKVEVNFPIKTSYSVRLGQELVIVPKIEQTNKERELSYFWSAIEINSNNKPIGIRIDCGNSDTLRFAFPKEATYMLRVEVRNGFGGDFAERVVEVKPVEQGGYFVVGVNEEGVSNIAFAPILSEEESNSGMKQEFISDFIRKMNPDIELKGVVKFLTTRVGNGDKLSPSLFIFCEDKICVADLNTFTILQQTNLDAQYGKIVAVQAEDETNESVRIYTSKGHNLLYSKVMYSIGQNTVDKNIYDKVFPYFYIWGSNSLASFVGVQYATSTVYTWEPNMNVICSSVDKTGKNVFEGYHIISAAMMNGNPSYVYIVSANKNNSNAIKIVEANNYRFNPGYEAGLFPIREYDYTLASPLTMPKEMNVVANCRYRVMYYSNMNKIYVWDLNKSTLELPTEEALSLGGNKEITTMAISFDMKELYVGFYDRDYPGELKGGMYVYDALEIMRNPNVQPKVKFEGITLRPVQIGFKPRANENGIYTYE